MSFSIAKVRSTLNYSTIGLKIKHIQSGIDKMAEIQLKYIEIYCVSFVPFLHPTHTSFFLILPFMHRFHPYFHFSFHLLLSAFFLVVYTSSWHRHLGAIFINSSQSSPFRHKLELQI